MLNIKLDHWKKMSETSREKVREYQAKYHMVQELFLEKVNIEGPEKVTEFEFTPGPEFMNIPTYDIVTSLLKIRRDEKLRDCVMEITLIPGREKDRSTRL